MPNALYLMIQPMICRWARCPALLVVALLTACGDNGTDPGSGDGSDPGLAGTSPRAGFETLLGPYAGVIDSEFQGTSYVADLTIVFQQSGRSISGSFSISGELTFGELMDRVGGTGSLTGTINPGLDPAVNITFVNDCPGYSASFSGTFESGTNLVTIRGPAHILVNCQIVLTFQSTIVMDRVVQEEHEAVAVSFAPEG